MIAFKGAVAGGKDDERPDPIVQSASIIGREPGMTNNIAEWRALRGAMKWLSSFKDLYANEDIIIFADSQLVAYQFNGHWRCNSIELRGFLEECTELKQAFTRLQVVWVPREQNWVADDLINKLYASKNIKVTVRVKKPKRDVDADLSRL